jgi:hypothetical protein
MKYYFYSPHYFLNGFNESLWKSELKKLLTTYLKEQLKNEMNIFRQLFRKEIEKAWKAGDSIKKSEDVLFTI